MLGARVRQTASAATPWHRLGPLDGCAERRRRPATRGDGLPAQRNGPNESALGDTPADPSFQSLFGNRPATDQIRDLRLWGAKAIPLAEWLRLPPDSLLL